MYTLLHLHVSLVWLQTPSVYREGLGMTRVPSTRVKDVKKKKEKKRKKNRARVKVGS